MDEVINKLKKNASLKMRVVLHEGLLINALHKNDLDEFKWLLQNGCWFSCVIYATVVKNQALDFMNVLKENGCPSSVCNKDNCSLLNTYGRMKVGRYMYTGHPWNFLVMQEAMNTCNMNIVKMVYDNGAPLDYATLICAIRTRNLDLFVWGVDHGLGASASLRITAMSHHAHEIAAFIESKNKM